MPWLCHHLSWSNSFALRQSGSYFVAICSAMYALALAINSLLCRNGSASEFPPSGSNCPLVELQQEQASAQFSGLSAKSEILLLWEYVV